MAGPYSQANEECAAVTVSAFSSPEFQNTNFLKSTGTISYPDI